VGTVCSFTAVGEDMSGEVPEHRNASWQTGVLSDWTITITAQSAGLAKSYAVHRFPLGVGQRSSELLYKVFAVDTKRIGGNSNIDVVKDLGLPGDQVEDAFQRVNFVFENDVLPFMYDARVNFTFANVFAIWRIAEYLQMHRLAEISKQFVNTNLIQKIAPKALQDSIFFGFRDIAQRCQDIIASTVDSFDVTELAFLEGIVILDIFNNLKFTGNDLSRCKIAAASLTIREKVIKPQERNGLLALFNFDPDKYGLSGSLKVLQAMANLPEADQKEISDFEDKCLDVVSKSFPQLLDGSGALLLTLTTLQVCS
jgi:hypothetical protein